MVCPMFVHRGSQLASVDDVFNGIMVRGDATGDVVFYGKGAGKLPTASAVVADVIDCEALLRHASTSSGRMRSRTTWPISAAWKRLHSCAFPPRTAIRR